MGKRVMLIGLVWIAVVSMWVSAAFGSNTRWHTGTASTKGVRCEYEVSGTGSTPTMGTCEVDNVQEAFLFCLNPNNGSVNGSRHGEAFRQIVQFGTGEGVGAGTKRGRSKYNAISNAEGTGLTPEECDASPECTELRQFCQNPNWLPRDVVPITMTIFEAVWECTSADNCPCDPAGLDGPVCGDHNPKTPELDPALAGKNLVCELPEPATFNFGEVRFYNCVDAGAL